jgi:hypothetical protein
LTVLYRSTHRSCRYGAPVKNPAPGASFNSAKNAPSKSGIKQLCQQRAYLRAKAAPACPDGDPCNYQHHPQAPLIFTIWSELHVRNPSTIRVVNHNMMTSSMNAAWCGWWLDG